MRKLYSETVPQEVIEPDTDGDIEVRFEWVAGTPESGRYSGPPENYDPGSADEFCIRQAFYVLGNGTLVPCGLAPHEHDAVEEWLDANWERPDYQAEEAEYRYQQYRDEQMERRA